jgi:hypothetical protein
MGKCILHENVDLSVILKKLSLPMADFLAEVPGAGTEKYVVRNEGE